MERFTRLSAIAAPMFRANIDTDAISPTNVPVSVDADYSNWGRRLFGVHRYFPDGSEIPDFVLNAPPYRDAQILVAGQNFGCGSSREHAVLALKGFGIRCILAPSFGEIFAANAFQNGVLVATLSEDVLRNLAEQLKAAERPQSNLSHLIHVDLEAQTVTAPDRSIHFFEIAEARKRSLLTGASQEDMLQSARPELDAYIASCRTERPWMVMDLRTE